LFDLEGDKLHYGEGSDQLRGEDPTGVISFYSRTGAGKSRILRALISSPDKTVRSLPLSSAQGASQSCTAGLQVYSGEWNGLPMIFFDSEGIQGTLTTQEKRTSSMGKHQETLTRSVYPRLLYLFSDVICYPTRAAGAEIQSFQEDLKQFKSAASLSTKGVRVKPSLCIIMNMRNPLPTEKVQTAQQYWEDARFLDEFKIVFSEIYVVHLGDWYANPDGTIDSIKQLKGLLQDQCQRGLKQRQTFQPPRLVCGAQLHREMEKIASRFLRDPTCELDGLELLISEHEHRALLEPNPEMMVQYFEHTQDFSRPTSLQEYEKDVKRFTQYLLRCYLLRQHYMEDSSHDQSYLKGWEEELGDIQKSIQKLAPCAAEYCHKRGLNHGNKHEMFGFGGALTRQSGNFLSRYRPDLTTIIEQLKTNRPKVVDVFQRIPNYSSHYFTLTNVALLNRMCASCGFGIPTVTFGCSHCYCGPCAQLLDRTTRKCLCKRRMEISSPAPPPGRFAGVRILSLDGGGTRLIVSLIVLQELESRIKNSSIPKLCSLNVQDLFDLIIGTSGGGIIALYLGTHKGKSIATAGESLKRVASTVFRRSNIVSTWCRRVWSYLTRSDYAQYDSSILDHTLRSVLPDKTMRGCSSGGPVIMTTMVDRCTHSLQVASSIPIPSPFAKSAKDGTQPYDVGAVCTTISAAIATSAAPTIFLAEEIDGHLKLDGGLLANCPAKEGIHIAERVWKNRSIEVVWSVATGAVQSQRSTKKSYQSFGDSIEYMISLLTNSERLSEEARNEMKKHYPHGKYHRLAPSLGRALPLDASSEADIAYMESQTKKFCKNHRQLFTEAVGSLLARMWYIDSLEARSPRVVLFTIKNRKAGQLVRARDFEFEVLKSNSNVVARVKNFQGDEKSHLQVEIELSEESTISPQLVLAVYWNTNEFKKHPISGSHTPLPSNE